MFSGDFANINTATPSGTNGQNVQSENVGEEGCVDIGERADKLACEATQDCFWVPYDWNCPNGEGYCHCGTDKPKTKCGHDPEGQAYYDPECDCCNCRNGGEYIIGPDGIPSCTSTKSTEGCNPEEGNQIDCEKEKGPGYVKECIQVAGSDPPEYYWTCTQISTSGGGGAGGSGGAGGAGGTGGGGGSSNVTVNTAGQENTIPQDLIPLRYILGKLLSGRVQYDQPKYPGSLQQGIPPEYAQVLDLLRGASGRFGEATAGARGAYQGMLGTDLVNPLLGRLAQFQDPLTRALAGPQDPTARQNLQFLANTGGQQDLTGVMDAIRARGMQDIEDFQASERERFGGMGLSSGSDVSESLGRGTSRGIAQMVQQQQALQAQAAFQRSQTRLGASSTLGGLDISEIGSLISAMQTGSSIAGMTTNAAIQQAALRAQGAQGLGGLAQAGYGMDQALATATGGVGDIRKQLADANMARQYNDWMRMQQPSPYLSAALSYATGFPPRPNAKPVIPERSGGGLGSILSALAMGGMSMLGGFGAGGYFGGTS